jgi:NAD(P)-dependent dehydrogenase (short-subunit alcohol dehydrogenase family)
MSQRSADDLDAFGGRTVVITGGATGIGLATARMVVDRGGRVILMGRTLGRLKAAQADLGAAAATAELDVTDEDAVRRAFSGIERIDHLITAAAGTLRGRLIDLDTRRARELFDTKFWGQYQCIKYAASRMAAGGSFRSGCACSSSGARRNRR